MADDARPKLYPNPFVTALHFTNFKALARVDIPLKSRFVVLVGANGVGKSSVLQGLETLAQSIVVNGHGLVVRANFEGLRSPGFIRTRNSTDSIVFGATAGGVRIDLDLEERRQGGQVQNIGRHIIGPWLERRSVAEKLGPLAGCRRFHFDAGVAVLASELAEDGAVAEDGANLPAAFSWLASNEPKIREAIERDLSHIVHGVRHVGVPVHRELRSKIIMVPNDQGGFDRKTVREPTPVMGLEIEFEGRGRLSSALVSEGTILVLALLTVLHQREPPTVVMLDDIDRGLHPEAQARLVEVIGRLLAEKPDLQIIATTHSPALVDLVHPDAVVIMASDANGHAHARTLSDNPRYNEWRKTLTPGEMWPYFGESWVTEASPAA